MNHGNAQEILREIRRNMNPCHVACTQFRKGVISKLTDAPESPDDHAVLELYLEEALPGIHFFDGVVNVDSFGLWYYDGDGDINGKIRKRSLIPWHAIKTLLLHQ